MSRRYGVDIKIKAPEYRYKKHLALDAASTEGVFVEVHKALRDIYDAMDRESGNEFDVRVKIFRYSQPS